MYSRAYVEITNTCNMNCSFCHGTKRERREMNLGEFARITASLKGVTEYLYFHVTDHLTAAELQTQMDLSKQAGMRKVKPHKDHMFSNVGLVILANTIEPEAVKLLKKTRFRKNYKLSFHGWTEYQLAAMEVSTNCFYANPAGAGARKIMEQNFAPKKGRN